ncbi:DNA mismatch endonuclease Vsr [Pseudomonas sp. sp1636]|uniref:very short patch repair endonuclease n=1 Tax=Pseudomonas sp. sp1636 TaxID=3036707 RepID=UPI0025A544AF|nr:DNA mismatch endonuclease Vsr [Pseudomonas sp. sp1636]MDM8347670.1 DNA mismatch endonuclease Vsr [Pseudomonas sp. sp1636]
MDTLSPHERSKRMGKVRSTNTKPELLVRQLVFSMGYRYRLHRKDLPGKPDLVFSSRKKIILVHGCFWHRHDDPSCRLARLPKSRLDFWLPKFDANLRRDALVADQLDTLGWDVLIIWECQLRDVSALENKIREFIEHKASS